MMTNDRFLYKEGTQKSQENYHVKISSDLLDFLCNDYSYKSVRRFSRLQAFQNLLERYCTSERKQEEMAANIEALSKSWRWSRPSVMRYIQNLEEMGVLEIFNAVTSKMVRIRKDIIVFDPGKSGEIGQTQNSRV